MVTGQDGMIDGCVPNCIATEILELWGIISWPTFFLILFIVPGGKGENILILASECFSVT